jgi:predicted AlkP superfamily phosphohydrolase/phosphomutase
LHTCESKEGNGAPARKQASWFADQGRQIDWAKTSVYMPVPGSYSLNLNLIGRQINGTVAPKDADRVLDEVTALCMGLRYPGKGVPVFSRVLRREEAFPGPYSRLAPDLLLVPHDESLMVSPDLSGNRWGQSYQTGLHRFEGMWIHRSKRTKPGRLKHAVRLIDVMPTLLADLGVPFPAALPGNVITDAFESGGRIGRSNDPVLIQNGGRQSDWEDEELTSRLRTMGYL